MTLRFDQEDALEESEETSLVSSLQMVLSVFMRKGEVEALGPQMVASWTEDCNKVLDDFMQSMELYVDGRIRHAAKESEENDNH